MNKTLPTATTHRNRHGCSWIASDFTTDVVLAEGTGDCIGAGLELAAASTKNCTGWRSVLAIGAVKVHRLTWSDAGRVDHGWGLNPAARSSAAAAAAVVVGVKDSNIGLPGARRG
jgi:hypothetical protein